MVILGREAKLYLGPTGPVWPTDPAVWTEISLAGGVGLAMGDVWQDRAIVEVGGWRTYEQGPRTATLRFGMLWERGSAVIDALVSGYLSGGLVPLAVMDGPVDAPGSRGLWADFVVVDLSIDQGMDERTAFGREIRIDEAAGMYVKAILGTGGRGPVWRITE